LAEEHKVLDMHPEDPQQWWKEIDQKRARL